MDLLLRDTPVQMLALTVEVKGRAAVTVTQTICSSHTPCAYTAFL